MKELVVLMLALQLVLGDVVLEERGFLRLPGRTNNYAFDLGTAKESAYDAQRRLLYVVGDGTQMLHVVNMNDVENMDIVLSHNFNPSVDGSPLDVEVCTNGFGRTLVAVSFESALSPRREGSVVFYNPVTIGQPILDPVYDEPQSTVGPHPDNIKFTSDCFKLVVSNEGVPAVEENTIFDPPGTVSIIDIPSTLISPRKPTVTTVNFNRVDEPTERDRLLEANVRWPIRQLNGSFNAFSNNIEPEYIAISPNNGYAYVTLQENNAIARVDLITGAVMSIYPLGTKRWSVSYMDPSEADSGINMQRHNVNSFYQPDKIAFFEWNGKLYLVTADEGKTMEIPEIGFRDYEAARTLYTGNEFNVDADLAAELNDNSILGQLYISSRFDGRNLNTDKIETAYTFGGRGFSVFDAQTMERVWESADQTEKYSRIYYPNTFNGDATRPNQTPPQERDTRSPINGGSLNAIADGVYNDQKLLMFANGRAGLIYVYTLADSVPDKVDLIFQSVHRRGQITDTWTRLYNSNSIGDAGIEDLTFVPIEDSPVAGTPLLIAVSSVSGSVSVYSFKDEHFPPQECPQ